MSLIDFLMKNNHNKRKIEQNKVYINNIPYDIENRNNREKIFFDFTLNSVFFNDNYNYEFSLKKDDISNNKSFLDVVNINQIGKNRKDEEYVYSLDHIIENKIVNNINKNEIKSQIKFAINQIHEYITQIVLFNKNIEFPDQMNISICLFNEEKIMEDYNNLGMYIESNFNHFKDVLYVPDLFIDKAFLLMNNTGYLVLNWIINKKDISIEDNISKDKIDNYFSKVKSFLEKDSSLDSNYKKKLPSSFMLPIHLNLESDVQHLIRHKRNNNLIDFILDIKLEQINKFYYFNPKTNSKLNNTRDITLENLNELYQGITNTFLEVFFKGLSISNDAEKKELYKSIGYQFREINYKPSETTINIIEGNKISISSTDIALVQGQHSTKGLDDILVSIKRIIDNENNLDINQKFLKDSLYKHYKSYKDIDVDVKELYNKFSDFVNNLMISFKFNGFNNDENSERFSRNNNNVKAQSKKDELLNKYKDDFKNLVLLYNEGHKTKILIQKDIFQNEIFKNNSNIFITELLTPISIKETEAIMKDFDNKLKEKLDNNNILNKLDDIKKIIYPYQKSLFSLEKVRRNHNCDEISRNYDKFKSSFFSLNKTIINNNHEELLKIIRSQKTLEEKIKLLSKLKEKHENNKNPNVYLYNTTNDLINFVSSKFIAAKEFDNDQEMMLKMSENIEKQYNEEIIKKERENNKYKIELLDAYINLVTKLKISYKSLSKNIQNMFYKDKYILIFCYNIINNIYNNKVSSNKNIINDKNFIKNINGDFYDDFIIKMYNNSIIFDDIILSFNKFLEDNIIEYQNESFEYENKNFWDFIELIKENNDSELNKYLTYSKILYDTFYIETN